MVLMQVVGPLHEALQLLGQSLFALTLLFGQLLFAQHAVLCSNTCQAKHMHAAAPGECQHMGGL